VTTSPGEIEARYETVSKLLLALTDVDGWVLTKGWEDLSAAAGDVDFLVHPSARARVEAAIWTFLQSQGPAVLVAFRCAHIPGVPRVFALAPALGFGSSLLEIDLAEFIPLRGFPLFTLDRLRPWVASDPSGIPRLLPEAVTAIRAASRLGWIDRLPLQESGLEVLQRLLPRLARNVWSASWLGAMSGPALSVALVASAAATSPSTLLRRVPFRLTQGLRGRACPFDPRAGRASRRGGDAVELRHRAHGPGHEVVI